MTPLSGLVLSIGKSSGMAGVLAHPHVGDGHDGMIGNGGGGGVRLVVTVLRWECREAMMSRPTRRFWATARHWRPRLRAGRGVMREGEVWEKKKNSSVSEVGDIWCFSTPPHRPPIATPTCVPCKTAESANTNLQMPEAEADITTGDLLRKMRKSVFIATILYLKLPNIPAVLPAKQGDVFQEQISNMTLL
ncbi:hypothetical protein G7046_g7570 [Stylonectria norvegica]|nr:hypothetical protein G7046_g7570 [Stylonectria norvegica]